MFSRTESSARTEGGYSLIDLMIGLAITVIVVSAAMTAIIHIYNVTSAGTNYIIAVREVQNAGHWLTLDGQRATNLLTGGPYGFPLTIDWNSADGNQHEVVYSLSLDNKLRRQHYTNRLINPNPDSTALVARFVDTANTSCNVTSNNELVARITAAVTIYHDTHIETRAYRIFPRPSLH